MNVSLTFFFSFFDSSLSHILTVASDFLPFHYVTHWQWLQQIFWAHTLMQFAGGKRNKYFVRTLHCVTQIKSLTCVAVNQISVWHFVFVSNFDCIPQSVDPNKERASCWENNSCPCSYPICREAQLLSRKAFRWKWAEPNRIRRGCHINWSINLCIRWFDWLKKKSCFIKCSFNSFCAQTWLGGKMQ